MAQILWLNRAHVQEQAWCITAFIYSWIIWQKIDRDVEFILRFSFTPWSPRHREKHGNNRGKKNLSHRIILHNNNQKLKKQTIQYLEQMALDLVRQLNYCIMTENHASISSLLLFPHRKVSENLIQTILIQIKLIIINFLFQKNNNIIIKS